MNNEQHNPLKNALKVLLAAQDDKILVEQFAYEKYLEEYGNENANGYSRYNGFEVISETEIKIKYVKRISGAECDGSFKVEIK